MTSTEQKTRLRDACRRAARDASTAATRVQDAMAAVADTYTAASVSHAAYRVRSAVSDARRHAELAMTSASLVAIKSLATQAIKAADDVCTYGMDAAHSAHEAWVDKKCRTGADCMQINTQLMDVSVDTAADVHKLEEVVTCACSYLDGDSYYYENATDECKLYIDL